MDQNQPSRKDELKTKATMLLKQARNADPMNLYMMQAAVDSTETSETELEELCSLLEEHNKKYEENFAEYKKEIDAATAEYIQSMAKKNPSPLPPVSAPNAPVTDATVQYGSSDATKQVSQP